MRSIVADAKYRFDIAAETPIPAIVRWRRYHGVVDQGRAREVGGRLATSVDHRLLRWRTLRALAAGTIVREDVCDAGFELSRAASAFGIPRGVVCPVCAADALREVAFAFGKGLPHEGQVVGGTLVEEALDAVPDVRLFRVEVCLACRWNFVIEERGHTGVR